VNLPRTPPEAEGLDLGGREGRLTLSSLMEAVKAFAIVTISAEISSFQQLLQAVLSQV
jgi:hypothetical protein